MRRRVALMLITAAALLAACGGAVPEAAPPPGAAPFEPTGSDATAQLVRTWQQVAWQAMEQDLVKPETKVERFYRTDATFDEIAAHYDGLVQTAGWWKQKRLPGRQGEFMLLGYEHGLTAMVVGVFDAAPLGGSGRIVYTLTGSK